MKKYGHKTSLIVDPGLFSDNEFNVKFLANHFQFITRCLSEIERYNPDLIAFPVITDDYLWACHIAKNIKKHFEDIPIVFVGIHPTAVPERVMKNNFVDFAITGEGEFALLELVNNSGNNHSWEQIKNLCCKSKEATGQAKNVLQNHPTLITGTQVIQTW